MPSFEKIAALEQRIVIQKLEHEADMKGFKDKFEALEKKIDLLLELLDTLQSLGKLANFFQKTVIFITKLSVAAGFVYAVYRFGIAELAREIKAVGSIR